MTWAEAYEAVHAGERFEDPAILSLESPLNMSIGELQISLGWRTEDPALLALSDGGRETLAHSQVRRGWRTENVEVLHLVDKLNRTVLEEQLARGWTTENPRVLQGAVFVVRTGSITSMLTVDMQLSMGWEPQTEEAKLVVFARKIEQENQIEN